MTERPILFSAPMVRALLDGTKTQTRRVAPIRNIKFFRHDSGDLVAWSVSFTRAVKGVLGSHSGGKFTDLQARSIIASQLNPYGQPGDRLWVRESIDGIWGCDAHYMADEAHLSEYIKDWWDTPQRLPCKKIPSIHMPRWASRITLEIVGVRVERLQDISHQDAIAEGGVEVARGWWSHDGTTLDTPGDTQFGGTAVDSYQVLWESINGSDSWDANPWVWVVEFNVVTLESQKQQISERANLDNDEWDIRGELNAEVSTMQSNDTTTRPPQHVGSTAEFGPVPMLHPCPFCGEKLAVKWRKVNPSARCITDDCWGSKMPALQLDIQTHVAAWNTRPNAADQICEARHLLIEKDML